MIFLITYEISSGDEKHISHHTIRARNRSEAKHRALEYISHFFAAGTRPDDELASRFWAEDESEYIELVEIKQTTPQQLVDALSIDD